MTIKTAKSFINGANSKMNSLFQPNTITLESIHYYPSIDPNIVLGP